MGHCPTLRGKEVVSLALGLTSPKRMSAIACPAWSPNAHVHKIAGKCVFSHSKANGLPVESSNTIGLPVLYSASNNWRWG